MKKFILIFVIIWVIAIAGIINAAGRSGQWPKVRAEHLKKYPTCAVCGGTAKLEVHHILPVHIRPDLELDQDNLITLCEAKKYGVNCHLFFGHLGNYKRYNPFVERDAEEWNLKLFTTKDTKK